MYQNSQTPQSSSLVFTSFGEGATKAFREAQNGLKKLLEGLEKNP